MSNVKRNLFRLLLLIVWLTACTSPTPAPLPTVAVMTSAPATMGAVITTIVLTDTPIASTSTPATATPVPATPLPTGPKVVLLTEGGAQIQPVHEQLQRAAQTLGWEYALVQDTTPSAVDTAVRNGGTVLVIDGPTLAEYARTSAQSYPDNYFITLAPLAGEGQATNLLALGAPRWDEAGFLAGMAAGFATTTQRVAAIADVTVAGLNYRNGFWHGVRYTCPRCDVRFIDVDAETVATAEQYATLNIDVIFGQPGQEAALVAAAQAGAWVIGAGRDVYVTAFAEGATSGADKVLTSVSIEMGAATVAALRAYEAATRGAGFTLTGAHPLGAVTGAVVIAPYRTEALNMLDQQDLATALARLAEGSLDTGIDPATGLEK